MDSINTNDFKVTGKIDLSKIAVDYQDELNKLSTILSLKKALVKFNKTDFYNRFFLIDVLNLSDANGKLALGKTEKNTSKKESAPKIEKPEKTLGGSSYKNSKQKCDSILCNT